MFDKTSTSTEQGNIGEAKAIYELTKRGYGISRTLFDSEKYDLIADDGERLLKVQVKTTRFTNHRGLYEASLKTSGGNTKVNIVRHRQEQDYDYLFVVSADERCWFIPATLLGGTSVTLGTKWDEYEMK